MLKRFECTFAGKSFGFSYLKWIQRVARRLGLSGVTFLRIDGSIKVIAEGEIECLEKFEEKLEKGHFWHQIFNFYIEWSDASGEYPDFFIQEEVMEN